MRARKRIPIRLTAVFVLILLIGICAGCSADDAATAVQSQGRDYGETYNLSEGDTMSTAFFDMTVNSATLQSEIDGYVPTNDTDRFLVVNITVKNTFDSDNPIPMSDADFQLSYDDADENDAVYPESAFAEDQLPASYEIAKGDSTTGNLIYVVPDGAADFKIYYYDLWDDDFEGNDYWLPFSVTA